MVDPLLGQISYVGFNFSPRGWALCHGQLLSIAQNSALFSLLGTTFGGDGRSTFGLPDLRSRTAIGVGTGPGLSPEFWGQRKGDYETVITVSNMPSHHHNVNLANGLGITPNSTNTLPASIVAEQANPSSKGDLFYNDATVAYAGELAATTINNTGGGVPINIRKPFLGLYVCIALQGVYPSRS